MKTHLSSLVPRMIRAGLRVNLRYRVVACGIDHRGRIISISTNTPRLPMQGYHAEERVIFSSPKSLSRILLLRVGSRGDLRPIDPCERCLRLATKRGVKIEKL